MGAVEGEACSGCWRGEKGRRAGQSALQRRCREAESVQWGCGGSERRRAQECSDQSSGSRRGSGRQQSTRSANKAIASKVDGCSDRRDLRGVKSTDRRREERRGGDCRLTTHDSAAFTRIPYRPHPLSHIRSLYHSIALQLNSLTTTPPTLNLTAPDVLGARHRCSLFHCPSLAHAAYTAGCAPMTLAWLSERPSLVQLRASASSVLCRRREVTCQASCNVQSNEQHQQCVIYK